ncbi:protein ripply2 [Lepisosteus oculatus]|uniref:protein ripply2 n=1 Tax=Lepisosteus oculatus TaxID=7918 RepID=UPI0003EAD71E|nr:PREDICTED: protein ripply2 [Lepisosteus oculatus]
MQDSGYTRTKGIAGERCIMTKQEHSPQRITNLWRPWCLQSESRRKERRTNNFPYPSPMVNVPGMKHTETVHPAKLFWPRSKCYDYLYHEAEILLRNYPVQATISFYEDSSTDTDSDSDEEDELN